MVFFISLFISIVINSYDVVLVLLLFVKSKRNYDLTRMRHWLRRID